MLGYVGDIVGVLTIICASLRVLAVAGWLAGGSVLLRYDAVCQWVTESPVTT
jgi:hypothetical protein